MPLLSVSRPTVQSDRRYAYVRNIVRINGLTRCPSMNALAMELTVQTETRGTEIYPRNPVSGKVK